jgi:hypothetical protein
LANDINISISATRPDELSVNAWCVAAFDTVVHVVWHNNDDDIYYRRSTDGGLTWESEQMLTDDTFINGHPSIAVVAETVHVAYQTTAGNGTIRYIRNDSGGVGTWSTPLSISAANSGHPCVAAQGCQVHFVWRSLIASEGRLIHLKHDGVTWQDTFYLTSENSADNPVIAVGGSLVHVVWRQSDGICYKHNTDYGDPDTSDWDSSVHLANSSNAHHPSVATCLNGVVDTFDVYVTWHAHDGSNFQIYYTRSSAGGNWANNVQVTDSGDNRWASVAAVDGYGHIVWCDCSTLEVSYKKVPSQEQPEQISRGPLGKEDPTINAYGDTLHVVWRDERNSNYDVYYNHCILDTIMGPPVAPYIDQVDKSTNDVVLTWNKITSDTIGYVSPVDGYIVYRDTLPNFKPASSDSIGFVTQPDTTFTDSAALASSDDYYYLVKVVDTTNAKSKKSNMGYKHNTFFNENPATSDKNWVSLPWHSEYSDVSDLTDDLSPAGDPLTKMTNLRDDQYYESWLWDDLFMEWTGTDYDIISGRGYEMVPMTDTSLFLVGSNNPDGLISLNENPGTTDKNWVSIPYNAVYSTVSDITDEYSPSGDPLIKITNLRDDQLYDSWTWDELFQEWQGTDFDITPGRGYEFVTVVDTTWNPTEYSNEVGKSFLPGRQCERMRINTKLGSSTETDRMSVWTLSTFRNNQSLQTAVAVRSDREDTDFYKLNTANTHTSVKQKNSSHLTSRVEDAYGDKGGHGVGPDDRKISHTVRSYVPSVQGFENFVFTTYRVDLPEDVLTEKIVGSGTSTNQQLGVMWFDAGNFRIPWKHGQEAILIIEATKNDEPYYDVIDYVLDEKLDIQRLRDIKLAPMPGPGSPPPTSTASLGSIDENDNIIGYSLYEGNRRLNSTILHDAHSVSEDVSIRMVIRGGHETVYSSDGIQSMSDQETPLSFAFSTVPNPFAKQVKISYALPKQTYVSAVIYDVTGRQVETLLSGEHTPGYYSTVWDGTDNVGKTLPSGIYFIKLDAGVSNTQEKILLIK